MQERHGRSKWMLLAPAALCLAAATQPAATRLVNVSRAHLCVTEGAIDALPGSRLAVNASKMRAYLNVATAQAVEAQFTYLGPTSDAATLGSGELRSQFGLKLRAADACNLIYAMWRIAPESKLVVSVKSNPGEHTSSACGNGGYRNVKPRRSTPVPGLRPQDTHVLLATMNKDALQVFVDNSLVWDGVLGAAALSFDGPVGMRSDNARLQIGLRAGVVEKGGQLSACRSSAEAAE